LRPLGLEVVRGKCWPTTGWRIFRSDWPPGAWWSEHSRLGEDDEFYFDLKTGLPLQYRRVADDARMVLVPERGGEQPPMLMDCCPVTVGQFVSVMRNRPLTPVHAYHGGKRSWPRGGASMPAHTVLMADINEYVSCVGATLPTRSEWVFAAQGTDARKYPWGDEAPTRHHVNLPGRWRRVSAVGAHPLAQSPFGIHDLVGNCEELTDDSWDSDSLLSEASYVTVCGGSLPLAPAKAPCNWSESWRYTRGPQPRPWLGFRCCLRLVLLLEKEP
jgi:formylglycine-generating enzyme required for sulfatase activity